MARGDGRADFMRVRGRKRMRGWKKDRDDVFILFKGQRQGFRVYENKLCKLEGGLPTVLCLPVKKSHSSCVATRCVENEGPPCSAVRHIVRAGDAVQAMNNASLSSRSSPQFLMRSAAIAVERRSEFRGNFVGCWSPMACLIDMINATIEFLE